MSAFGGDSPLSDAPSSNFSPVRKPATPIAVEPEVPAAKGQPKNKKAKAKPPTKAQPATDLFPSRRSSRISDRSTSPEKAASPTPAGEGEGEGSSKPVIATNLKIKLRYTSPGREKEKEKTALNDETVVEQPEPELAAEEASTTTVKARGKKRKSEVGHGIEEEVRREMGKKKSKVSHQSQSQDQEVEPQKSTSKSKNVAIKRKSVAGGKSTNDIIADFLDEEEVGQKKEIVAKPQEEANMRTDTDTKKSKKRRNTTTTADVDAKADADVAMDEAAVEPEVVVEKANTDQTQTDGIAPPARPTTIPRLKLKSEGGKATQKSRKSEEVDPSPARADPTPPTQTDSARITEESSVDPNTKADPTTSHVEKPKKSFAQVVASSEKAAAGAGTASPREPKKEKRPLPSVPKFAKSSTNANTPLKAGTSGPGTSTPGTGPSTGTKKAPLPTTASSTPGIPAQRKVTQAPSLLEQTMANLLGGNVAATTAKGTPKAKKDETNGSTPKNRTPSTAKPRPKGSWAEEWVLTPSEQRDVLESRPEREAARLKRLEYRKNPVNLQEAKDAYRLDSTKPRVVPPIEGPHTGWGVRTEGAPSKMVQVLLDRHQARAGSNPISS